MKVSGTIHNPHFYEWQRESGENIQNPGAIACGGIPGYGQFLRVMEKIRVPCKRGHRFHCQIGHKFINNHNGFCSYLASYDKRGWGKRNALAYLDLVNINGMEEVTFRVRNGTEPECVRIITGEYLRKGRKDIVQGHDVDLKINKTILIAFDFMKKIANLHRASSHFTGVELDRLRRDVNGNEDYERERVKFIMKELEEEKFKTHLMKDDRKRKKKLAILNIYEVFNGVLTDAIRTIWGLYRNNHLTTNSEQSIYDEKYILDLSEQIVRVERVREFCNVELLKISKTYNQCVPCIRESGYTDTINFKDFKTVYKKTGWDNIFNNMCEQVKEWEEPAAKIKLSANLKKVVNNSELYKDVLIKKEYQMKSKAISSGEWELFNSYLIGYAYRQGRRRY